MPKEVPPVEAVYQFIVVAAVAFKLVLDPKQMLVGDAVTAVGAAGIPEVNVAVLVLVEVEHPVAVIEIAVIFTILADPDTGSEAVVKVPVPGAPEVNVMLAVVLDIVFVPLTL